MDEQVHKCRGVATTSHNKKVLGFYPQVASSYCVTTGNHWVTMR